MRTNAATLLLLLLAFAQTIQAQPAKLSEDAYTSTGSPNANFGANASLRVTTGTQATFLKFDLANLPDGVTGNDIAKATLTVWVNTLNTSGAFDVWSVANPWTEGTITANTAPPLDAVQATEVAISVNKKFVSVDLTDLVKTWVDDAPSNNGIALIPGAAGISAVFDSKENTGAAHEPRLDITLPPTNISVRVFNSADISVPSAGPTPQFIAFDSEHWDTADMHDLADPTRLTAPVGGNYLIFVHLDYEPNPAGMRDAVIFLNGIRPIAYARQPASPSSDTFVNISTHYELVAGDFVELLVAQDSGVPTLIRRVPNDDRSPEFGMVRIP